MAPLRRLRSCFFDNGPRFEIREGDLSDIRRRYLIHPSVGMRSPTEFERTPDGGAGHFIRADHVEVDTRKNNRSMLISDVDRHQEMPRQMKINIDRCTQVPSIDINLHLSRHFLISVVSTDAYRSIILPLVDL
uniref:Uncharacterized protein n=1 Tax=Brassica campestris TaxID=3711 RepID=M4FI06_BRACM